MLVSVATSRLLQGPSSLLSTPAACDYETYHLVPFTIKFIYTWSFYFKPISSPYVPMAWVCDTGYLWSLFLKQLLTQKISVSWMWSCIWHLKWWLCFLLVVKSDPDDKNTMIFKLQIIRNKSPAKASFPTRWKSWGKCCKNLKYQNYRLKFVFPQHYLSTGYPSNMWTVNIYKLQCSWTYSGGW